METNVTAIKSEVIEDRKKKTKKKLLSELRTHGNISVACTNAGISRRAYYSYMKNDSLFNELVEEIQEGLIDRAECKLHEKIESGDVTSLIFFLKTKGKNRGYVEKTETQLSGKVETVQISTDEVLARVQKYIESKK